MYLQKVHLDRVVLRRMWTVRYYSGRVVRDALQLLSKVRHVLWLSSCGIRQPSFLLAHRWDLESWGGGVAFLPVTCSTGLGAWPVGVSLLCRALVDLLPSRGVVVCGGSCFKRK